MKPGKKGRNSKTKWTGLNGDALLTEKEAATYLKISAQWLRASRMQNPTWAGPRFVRISPHVVRYRLRHLDEFVAARTIDPADRISA